MDPQPQQPAAPVNPLLAHLNDTDEAHASTRVDFAHPGSMVQPMAKSPHPAMYPKADVPKPEVPVAPVAPPPPPPPAPPPPPVAPPLPKTPKSPRNNRPIIIAVIIVLILAAAGGGAYWWFKVRKPANKATNNNQTTQQTQLMAVTPSSLSQLNASSQTVSAGGALKNPLELDFTLTTNATTGSATPQVEVEPLGTAFTGQSNYSGTAITASGSNLTAKVSVTGLKDGSYHWQARTTVGSVSSSWAPFAATGVTTADFIVDSTPPAVPVVTSVGSQSVKAGVTSITTTANPTTLAGTGEAGDAIAIAIAPDNQATTATVDNTGHWTATLTAALANGAHTVTITSSDQAGNTSTASFTINSNTVAAAPATQQVAPTGDSTRNLTLVGLLLIVVAAAGLVVVTRHGSHQV